MKNNIKKIVFFSFGMLCVFLLHANPTPIIPSPVCSPDEIHFEPQPAGFSTPEALLIAFRSAIRDGEEGDFSTLKKLLAGGLGANAKSFSKTPLTMAALSPKCCPTIIEMFLEDGAKPMVCVSQEESPLPQDYPVDHINQINSLPIKLLIHYVVDSQEIDLKTFFEFSIKKQLKFIENCKKRLEHAKESLEKYKQALALITKKITARESFVDDYDLKGFLELSIMKDMKRIRDYEIQIESSKEQIERYKQALTVVINKFPKLEPFVVNNCHAEPMPPMRYDDMISSPNDH